MKKSHSVPHRNLTLAVASLLLPLILNDAPASAATLHFQSDRYLLDDFNIINEAFVASNVMPSEAILLSKKLTIADLQESAQLPSSVISLSELTKNIKNAPSLFTSIFNDLKQVRLFEKGSEVTIRTLPQSSFADASKGVYEFTPTLKPKSPEQLVGDPLNIDRTTIPPVSAPNSYYYNNGSTQVGVTGIGSYGLPDSNTIEEFANAGSGNVSPDKQIGIGLDRVSVEDAEEYDSALQLWPRTPFQLEPTGYSGNVTDALEQTNEFGRLSLNVNYALMPRDILLTPLDLRVDWINRGEYSENLRDTIQQTNEVLQQRQAEFLAQVEARRQASLEQQQQFQQQVQQGMTQSFQLSEQQRTQQKLRGRNLTGTPRYQQK